MYGVLYCTVCRRGWWQHTGSLGICLALQLARPGYSHRLANNYASRTIDRDSKVLSDCLTHVLATRYVSSVYSSYAPHCQPISRPLPAQDHGETGDRIPHCRAPRRCRGMRQLQAWPPTANQTLRHATRWLSLALRHRGSCIQADDFCSALEWPPAIVTPQRVRETWRSELGLLSSQHRVS